jgi:hypothetical protein
MIAFLAPPVRAGKVRCGFDRGTEYGLNLSCLFSAGTILTWCKLKCNPLRGLAGLSNLFLLCDGLEITGAKKKPNLMGWAKTDSNGNLANLGDFVGLRSFLTLHHLKFHKVAFLEGLEAFTLNGGVVDENVRSTLLTNETITFAVIEPLYLTLKSCHFHSSSIAIEAAGRSVNPLKSKSRESGWIPGPF